jgi:hypothetical protein
LLKMLDRGLKIAALDMIGNHTIRAGIQGGPTISDLVPARAQRYGYSPSPTHRVRVGCRICTEIPVGVDPRKSTFLYSC